AVPRAPPREASLLRCPPHWWAPASCLPSHLTAASAAPAWLHCAPRAPDPSPPGPSTRLSPGALSLWPTARARPRPSRRAGQGRGPAGAD
ncbi:hypothetical protein P7K49_006069, partial [Saguinus oedipus]